MLHVAIVEQMVPESSTIDYLVSVDTPVEYRTAEVTSVG